MRRVIGLVSALSLLASCGGGGGGGGGSTAAAPASPTPTATAGCSLRERQDWAAAQLREWYLFPDTLPSALDPSPYASVDAYVDALTATARAQRKDRYFTYLTSIAQENAYNNSGATAGFGFRVSADATSRRVFIAEAFEGTAALAAGIDRGTEITAIGTSTGNLRTVSAIIAAEGTAGVTAALGPSTTGTTRVLRVTGSDGASRDVTLAKTDYALAPVSTRYGAGVIDDAGTKVAYLNLRTFITPANQPLRDAFAGFRAQGITKFIVDLRYNGGGLISTAELFGDLLGGNRATSEVFDYVSYRPEKASNNTTKFFAPQPQSASPVRIAFIGREGTASASELLINGFIPFLGANVGLIGTNTYGKPVGQIALDRAACDDRLRVIALAVQNANRSAAYYDGLAGTVQASCQAGDDFAFPLGDRREASVARALDFLAGRSCTPIAAGVQTAQAAGGRQLLLTPARPDTAQREVPGLF